MKKRIYAMLVLFLLTALSFSVNAAEWTWMVYMDGDCNLEADALNDFNEMATVGSNANINIVVQFDRISGESSLYGNWTDTRRFFIKKGDNPLSTPVQNLGEMNMGDPNTLKNFIVWAMQNYPAKKYALILWNHGGGWRKRDANSRAAKPNLHKAICWDDSNNGDCLYMSEVKFAISSAKTATGVKLNLIGCDACLMGMVEVATDVKDLADVLVASEEVEPGAGWPYNTIMSALNTTPTMDAKTLGSTIVDKYNTSYSGQDATVTQSATDLTKISALNAALKNFVNSANQWSKIKTARTNTLTYSEADGYPHADLYHFMSNLSGAGITDPVVLSGANSVMTSLKSAVINSKCGSQRSKSNGLAIFFPKTKTDYNNAEGSAYPGKDFNTATGWNSFLLNFFTPPADKPIGGGGTTPPAVSVDGTGSAKFSRTTPVPKNTKVSSVTFYFTSSQTLSGGQVTLTIPSGWTPPASSGTAGLVAVANYTGVSCSLGSVSGQTITVNCGTLPAGKKFKITYKNFYGSTQSGIHTFVVKSKGAGGTLKEIAVSPSLSVDTKSKAKAKGKSKKSKSKKTKSRF